MSRQYQLIDFGNGRKLESLAGRIVDRPSPAADGVTPRDRSVWERAESHYDLTTKSWTHRTPWPDDLSVEFELGAESDAEHSSPENLTTLRLPVQPTPFGHIGIFPEQADNWRWLYRTAPTAENSDLPARSDLRKALNLFAYTGASSMALSLSGMHVAHVDAAKPNVEAAKRAATANNLTDAPIRYLVDDAAGFVQREIRRGNRYHTIVLDPPAYGHGPKSVRPKKNRPAENKSEALTPAFATADGSAVKRPARQAQAWRLQRDLPDLLKNCLDLFSGRAFRLLLTGHSAEMDQHDVLDVLKRKLTHRRLGRLQPDWKTGRMSLQDASGRKLDAGFFVRVQG